MADSLGSIHAAYVATKEACKKDFLGESAAEAIERLADLSSRFLADECRMVQLVSRVPGKSYVTFARKGNDRVLARPANHRFFLRDPIRLRHLWRAWRHGSIGQDEFARFSYTVALAPCLVMELFDRQNKKGPATYFECLIGHMFAREMGVAPAKDATLDISGRRVRLTMDFLFTRRDGGQVHLPVKMSSRERVVQAWAHQRILDAAYGRAAFKGIMVLFSETKLDSRSREVVEICVPDQWLAYQALLSSFDRIYYFDIPSRYEALSRQCEAVIQIKPFGEFFREKALLFGPPN